MKATKRILSALLAAAMVVPFAAGCGGDAGSSAGTDGSSAASADSGESSGTDSGERVKITWAMWVDSSVEEANDAEQRLMEKMPNVEIDFMPFERATWQDQLNTRVAGGDIPDIIYRDSQGVVAQYAEQGVI